jgi:hypothetical protein
MYIGVFAYVDIYTYVYQSLLCPYHSILSYGHPPHTYQPISMCLDISNKYSLHLHTYIHIHMYIYIYIYKHIFIYI